MHMLICTVSYVKGAEKKSFRKFFKFTVMESLEWEQRIMQIKDNIFLEIQLRNLMRGPLFLNTPHLIAKAWKVLVVSPPMTAADPLKTGQSAFNPGAVRSYLFQLLPRQHGADKAALYSQRLRSRVDGSGLGGQEMQNIEDEDDDSSASDEMQLELARINLQAEEMVLGKLLLSWHSAFGEAGKRKILIKYKPSVSPEVEIAITSIAETITLETPFAAVITITNKSPRTILPMVQLGQDRLANVVPTGLSGGLKLDEMEPGSSKSAEVTFLPLQAGIQTIGGLSVMDKKTGRVYSCSPHEIIVLQAP